MKFLDKVGLTYWTSKLKSYVNQKIDDSKYVHPDSHPATMITEDAEKRFVSDGEKETWNNKLDGTSDITNNTVNIQEGVPSITLKELLLLMADNFIDSADIGYDVASLDENAKVPIDQIPDEALKDTIYTAGNNISIDSNNVISAIDTKYTHPSTHSASMITQSTSMRFVSDTEKNTWNNKVDKVSGKQLSTNDYTTVEKNKLAGIQVGAQKNTITSVNGKTGAVTITKSDLGLGSVENIGIKILTQSQYDALSPTEKNRTDKLYGIYEG